MSNLLKDNKELMKEYNYKKNTDVDLDSITLGSTKKIWWICKKCGNEWPATVSNRSYGKGCNKCYRSKISEANHRAAAKKHNLVENYPYLKNEWDYEKNYPLKAEEFGYGSEEEVWWKCSWCNSSFKQRINKRALRGYGCPVCSNWKCTSFIEQAIFYYINLLHLNVLNRDTSTGYEFDIYIPSKKIAIEYDGSHWHNSPKKFKKENIKDKYCRDNGIKLFRIRNKKLPKTNYATIIEYNENGLNSLNAIIKKLLSFIDPNNKIIVNVSQDVYKIIKEFRVNLKENSLEYKYPRTAKMWDYEKNNNLSPSAIFPTSAIKYWWKCPICGESWQASAGHMTRSDREVDCCPSCSKKKVNKNNTIKIVNIDLNIVYDSLTEAANSVNGRKGDICDCCNGNQKTAFGYHWKYLNENQRRRKNISGKVLNIDTGIVYNNSREAANSVNGDSRMINRCCRGEVKTSYGYHW